MRDGDSMRSGKAEVRLDFLPAARVHVDVQFEGTWLSHINFAAAPGVLLLSDRSLAIDGFPVSITHSSTSGTTMTWAPRQEPIQGLGADDTELAHAVFHLVNFKNVLGTPQSPAQSGKGMCLEDDMWSIQLSSLPQTKDHFKALSSNGGYAITHVARLRKADGGVFCGKAATDVLLALRFFLSFAKGAWCAPICPVGFSPEGERAWEQWSSPQQSWKSPMSWFDQHSSSQLETLFPCFMNRWNNECWRTALQEVLYWYMNANDSHRGIDAGIVLTQAAIERLSFEYAVRNRRLIEVQGFKDLRASDKYRLLFSSLDVPIDIPSEASDLTKLAAQFNWQDAPHALTEIRNSLVHPEHKRRNQLDKAYFDAWRMGLWLLELSVLRVCGYEGTYGNRLKSRCVGEVEPVPWKRTAPDTRSRTEART